MPCEGWPQLKLEKKPVTIDITGAHSGLVLQLHAARSLALQAVRPRLTLEQFTFRGCSRRATTLGGYRSRSTAFARSRDGGRSPLL